MYKGKLLEDFVPWPDEVVRKYKLEGYWEDLSLGQVFGQWVRRYNNRAALSYRGKEITYQQMDEYVTRLSYYMVNSGIGTYDRVIVQLFNVPELVYLIYACMKIGAIPICSLPTHRWAEISYLANESEAKAHVIPATVVKDFNYEEFAEELRRSIPSIKYIFTDGKSKNSGIFSISDIIESDIDVTTAAEKLGQYCPDPMQPALFQLSGGTTGVPKIIPRTHNDYYYNAKCVADALNFDKNVRLLVASPLMHNLAFVNGLLPVHYKGGVIVVTPSYAPEAIFQSIQMDKANTMVTVPVLLHRMLSTPEEVRTKYDISSLKQFLWGGNRVEPDLQLRFREIFHCDTNQTYGMAEGLVMWTRPSDPLDIKLRTQGKPISVADDIKIVDVNTDQEVMTGQVGELLCRGPYTLRGYYKSPERNKEVFTQDGYYRTGDLVIRDDLGNYTVAGRIKDCISRGAEKINAEEVEAHIMKFIKVKNVAIVAMPDKVMGERVCAFVVPQPGHSFTLEELNEFLLKERKIAKFKVPERLEFIDELPVSKIGKFEKKTLREKISRILSSEKASEAG